MTEFLYSAPFIYFIASLALMIYDFVTWFCYDFVTMILLWKKIQLYRQTQKFAKFILFYSSFFKTHNIIYYPK